RSEARLMKSSVRFGVGLSLFESSKNGARDLSAGGFGSGGSSRLKRAAVEPIDLGALRQGRWRSLFGEEASEFSLQGFADAVAVAGGETVQDQFFDVQFYRR